MFAILGQFKLCTLQLCRRIYTMLTTPALCNHNMYLRMEMIACAQGTHLLTNSSSIKLINS